MHIANKLSNYRTRLKIHCFHVTYPPYCHLVVWPDILDVTWILCDSDVMPSADTLMHYEVAPIEI